MKIYQRVADSPKAVRIGLVAIMSIVVIPVVATVFLYQLIFGQPEGLT